MLAFVALLLGLVCRCSASMVEISPLITPYDVTGAGYSSKTGWVFYSNTYTFHDRVVQSSDLTNFSVVNATLPPGRTSYVIGSECGVYIYIGNSLSLTTNGTSFTSLSWGWDCGVPVSNGTHLLCQGGGWRGSISPGPCSGDARPIGIKLPWIFNTLVSFRGRYYGIRDYNPPVMYEMYPNGSDWKRVFGIPEIFNDIKLVSPSPERWLILSSYLVGWTKTLHPEPNWPVKFTGFDAKDACCFQDGETCPFVSTHGLHLFNFSTTDVVQVGQNFSATMLSITCRDNGEVVVTGTAGFILSVPETFGLPSSDWKLVIADNGVASSNPTNIWGEESNFNVSVADGPSFTSADGGKTWAADPQTRPLPTLVEVPCAALPQAERPSTGEWCSYGVGMCPASTASCLVVVERSTLNTYYHALPVADGQAITILNNTYIIGSYKGILIDNTTIYAVESPVSMSAKWRKAFPKSIVAYQVSFASTGSAVVLSFQDNIQGPGVTYITVDAMEWNTYHLNTSYPAAVCQWGDHCLVFGTYGLSNAALITRRGTVEPFALSDKFRSLQLMQHFPSAGVSVLVTSDGVTYACRDFTDPNTCSGGHTLPEPGSQSLTAAGAARGHAGRVRVAVAYGSATSKQLVARLFAAEIDV